MNKKLVLLGAGLLLTIATASAQKRVTGRVVDAQGEPVVGASVRVEGSKLVAPTDADGKFILQNVPSSAKKLLITYVGKESQSVSISNNVKVVMKDNDNVLDEAMVVAYGTQKKATFTGSAAIVDAGEIGKVQVTNAVDALKGKASGIQINTASGQPGSTPTIRIRGVNSINAESNPLLVVDGSPYDGSLNDINPADVESMTVLKDASSTSLYGARGGNGVILITTKKAKQGDGAKITFDAKWGSNSKAVEDYETIKNPAAYYEMWYKGLYNYALNGMGYDAQKAWQWANANLINGNYGLGYNVYTVPQGEVMIGTNGKLNPNATLGRIHSYNGQNYLLLPDDWEDETYGNGLRQEYTVTAQSANERGSFYASANYLDNEGITVASDYKRFSARLKADQQLKSWLKVGVNMAYSHFNYNDLGDDGSSSSSSNMFAMVAMAPIYPMFIRDEQGNIIYDHVAGVNRYDYGDGAIGLSRPFMSQANPVSSALLDVRNHEGNTFNGTGTFEVKLPLGFKFTSINNVYLRETRNTTTTNSFYGQYADLGGKVSKSHSRNWSTNYQQRLDWSKSFGKHNVDAMVAHEGYRIYGYALSANKSNQYSPANDELDGAVVMGSASSYTTDYNTESWLGRAQYNYDDTYFLSLSYVREASSMFHPDNRWGNFWSVGAGWLINKEKWFNVSWIDYLKLKASYGENGNDNIDSYLYTNTYKIVNNNNQVSIVPITMGNKDITWEKNGKFNVGVDFGIFGDRLTGSVEYYSNNTYDMLSWFPLPASFGFTGYYANIGNMRNNGVEIELRGDVFRTKDLTWTLYGNITSNHNEITKLPDERKTMTVDGHDGYSSGSFFYTEGMSRYTWFDKKYAGVDPETGKALYYQNVTTTDDQGNQVTTITTTDQYGNASDYLCGDVLPDFYGGFGTSFQWKGLDLSVDFQYQIGGLVYDSSYQQLMGLSRGQAMHVDQLAAWSTENPNSNIPRIQYKDDATASSSDRFLTNASYLTLSNITLGYTLPKKWTNAIGAEKIRFYVVGDNLYTWSKRKGLDPRQSISGSTSQAYYRPIRTISGGITITL